MFVGVKDSGEIAGVTNPNDIQKSVSEKIADAYPPISSWTATNSTPRGEGQNVSGA